MSGAVLSCLQAALAELSDGSERSVAKIEKTTLHGERLNPLFVRILYLES